MPWNPDIYNQFKDIRYKPFFDLAGLIKDTGLKYCVDLGCGTGEQTAILAQQFPQAHFAGIDSSEEMLAGSAARENERLHFEINTIEAFGDGIPKWDLLFSNAALQWSDDHAVLFPKLIATLLPGGQLAVQMPFQKENILNQLLLGLVKQQPFVEWLDGFTRESPLLQVDEYASLLFKNGIKDIDLSLRVYPIIASSAEELYRFISGSALIPYLERLSEEQRSILRQVFLQKIEEHFGSFPAIYSFKRILMHGSKA